MPVPPPPDAKKVFEGVLADVYQWPQTLYDGSVTTFESYVRPDTVAVIAFLDPQTILMTRQEQPSRSRAFWDPPGGMVDPGETAEEAAQRELMEETGYQAGRLMLWHVDRYEGITLFEDYVYVATDLKPVEQKNSEDVGEKIVVHKKSMEEVVAMSLNHEMRRNEIMLSVLGMHYVPEQRAKLEAFLSGRT